MSIKDVQGNEDVNINCNYTFINNNCLSLFANTPILRETTSYSLNSIPYTPYGAFNSGTALNANFDDVFAGKISIPFKFCFFGNVYDQIVLSDNGLITFDATQYGKLSYPNIGNTNPNPALPLNAIFGVYQDLRFSSSDNSDIYYSVIGTVGCRKLIINYYEGRIVGCTDRSSTQIVLSEATNEIEIFVDKKPLPCSSARFHNSLLGIINNDGTLGYSPPSRNTGVWQANKEAWKFSPAGNVINPVIEWFDAQNNSIGFGSTISICPNGNTRYSAKATYTICNSPVVLTDDISINFVQDFPLAKDFTKIFCNATGTIENINLDDYRQNVTPQTPSNLVFTYHNSFAEANSTPGLNPQSPNISLTSGKTYYVRIQNPSNPKCFRIAELKFQLINDILIKNTVDICDSNNNALEENFLLSTLNPQLFSNQIQGTVSYYLSQTDLNNNNPVTTANITSSTKLWIKFVTTQCTAIFGPITINFIPGPNVNTPINHPITMCDINDDQTEIYDFQSLNLVIGSSPNLVFKYYSTLNEALTNIGSQITNIREGKYSIFVRVEEAGGCFSIAEVKLDVKFNKVQVVPKNVFLCFDGTTDQNIDLNVLSQNMLISPLTATKKFYATEADATVPEKEISPNQVITDDGNQIIKDYFVRFEDADKCYTIRKITVYLTHPVAMKNSFEICDFENNSTENVILNQFDSSILGSQGGIVTYFTDASATIAITNYTLTGTVILYAKVTVNQCSEIYPITFSLTPTPIVNPSITNSLNNICDNNNDGVELYNLTQHESQIYSGTNPVKFSYYSNYDPASHTFSNEILDPVNFYAAPNNTVYVKIKFNSGECFSVSKINIQMTFLPTIVLRDNALLKKCDVEFNFNEKFDLNEAIPQLFIQTENSILLSNITVSYYDNERDANAGLASTQISNLQYPLTSLKTVYARFQSNITQCYSVKPILLKTYFPPKAISSVITGICDQNLDGSPEVNLLNYVNSMVDVPNPENNFSFYTSLANAVNGINAIQNPANFTANPFPSKIWVKVENIPGCSDIAEVQLQLGTKVPLVNSGPLNLNDVCDVGNDGKEILNLTQFESQIYPGATFEYYTSINDLQNSNKIQNPGAFAYDSNLYGNKIFVKVVASGFCPNQTEIIIDLKKTPIFIIPDHYFCKNWGTVDIKPDFTGLNIVSFEWKNPAGQVISTTNELLGVQTEGVYTISVVAANGCTFSTTFNVKPFDVPVITQLIPNGNSYTVIATGSPNKIILYSIDGINWQFSNVFNNLQAGVINFYVKFQVEDCIGEIKQGLILNIPNVFTPNADGINDTWEIRNLNVLGGGSSSVKVFDKFQNVVFQQESKDKIVWDGKYLGRGVPTATYWYVLKLADGRLFTGWVLVKNRN